MSTTKDFTNNEELTFTVRIVNKGDCYGRNWCQVYEGDMPMVEFYDSRYKHTEYGQFVSRYALDTLIEWTTGGIDLYGGVPAWTIVPDTMNTIREWITNYHPVISKYDNFEKDAYRCFRNDGMELEETLNAIEAIK